MIYDNVSVRMVKKREAERYSLKAGDIIVVKSSGSKAKVIFGRAALFAVNTGLYLPSNFTFAVRTNQEVVNPVFLCLWLNSEYTKRVIENMVSTFTYPNLKKTDYENIPVPLPPLSEQKRIVNQLEALQDKIKALEEAQKKQKRSLKDWDNPYWKKLPW